MSFSFGFGFATECIAVVSMQYVCGVQISFCHNDYNMVRMLKPESSFFEVCKQLRTDEGNRTKLASSLGYFYCQDILLPLLHMD